MNQQTTGLRLRLPDDLIERDQWVLWRRESETKIPYRPDGHRASTTNPGDWSEFETVVATLERYSRRYAGVGFVFAEWDPFAGIDLDNCLDASGSPKPWARKMIERFADTYMEISPSGRGIKIFCKGRLPAAIGKIIIQDGGFEAYDRKRYFTTTGRVFRGAPFEIEDHQTDLDTLVKHFTERKSSSLAMARHGIADGRIPTGTRHNTLVSIAGTLRRIDLCDQAVLACLLAVNKYQCEEPEPESSISLIVTSSRQWRERR